jgi:hypothetical protein
MRQSLICLLSLPILIMLAWFYLDKRKIKQRELKRIHLRARPLPPDYLHILQTDFQFYLRLPDELQKNSLSIFRYF